MSATVTRDTIATDASMFEGRVMTPREIRLARAACLDGTQCAFVPACEIDAYIAERYPLPRTSKAREEVDTFGNTWRWEHGRLFCRRHFDTPTFWLGGDQLPTMNDGNREAISKVLADPVVYVEIGE